MLDKLKKNKQQIEAKEIDESNVDKKDATNYEIESPGKLIIRRLKQNKFAMIGLALLIFMFIFSFIGPLLSPYGYNDRSALIKAAPSLKHWFGTDYLGRDVLTRVMVGGRISIAVGVVSVVISVVVGTLIGSIAGYYGGKIDMIIMRLVDIFYCIPFFPLMLVTASLMSAFGVKPQMKIYYLMLIMGVFNWSGVARMVMGQILSIREMDYMQAAEACGLSVPRKIFKHLIPNVTPVIIVMATMDLGGFILTESALSFLGVGLAFPYASLGNMVNAVNSSIIMKNYLNIWLPPGILILFIVMAFNFIGDGLRDAFDPKMKR